MSDPFKEIREAANGAFDYINADDYVRWARGSMSDEEERIFDDLMRVVEHRNALRARLEEAERLLAETTDALFHTFRWADMHEEVMEGRWDGVRAIVEENERFLKEGR